MGNEICIKMESVKIIKKFILMEYLMFNGVLRRYRFIREISVLIGIFKEVMVLLYFLDLKFY